MLDRPESSITLLDPDRVFDEVGEATETAPLRIAPSAVSETRSCRGCAGFRERFPRITVRLQVSDRIAGIQREPVDVALRYGDAPDSNLVALPHKSWLDVADDVTAGRLVRLCDEWEGEPAALCLVCSDGRQLAPAVRLLCEHLQRRCAEHSGQLVTAGVKSPPTIGGA